MHLSFCIHASIVPVHLVHQFLQQFDALIPQALMQDGVHLLVTASIPLETDRKSIVLYFSCIVTPGHLQCDCACKQRTTNNEIPRLVFVNKGADQKLVLEFIIPGDCKGNVSELHVGTDSHSSGSVTAAFGLLLLVSYSASTRSAVVCCTCDCKTIDQCICHGRNRSRTQAG